MFAVACSIATATTSSDRPVQLPVQLTPPASSSRRPARADQICTLVELQQQTPTAVNDLLNVERERLRVDRERLALEKEMVGLKKLKLMQAVGSRQMEGGRSLYFRQTQRSKLGYSCQVQ